MQSCLAILKIQTRIFRCKNKKFSQSWPLDKTKKMLLWNTMPTYGFKNLSSKERPNTISRIYTMVYVFGHFPFAIRQTSAQVHLYPIYIFEIYVVLQRLRTIIHFLDVVLAKCIPNRLQTMRTKIKPHLLGSLLHRLCPQRQKKKTGSLLFE